MLENGAPTTGAESAGSEGVSSSAPASMAEDSATNTATAEAEVDRSVADSTPTDTTPNRAEEFEKLIKGDYKDEFDGRVQGIINERFKATKEQETKLASYEGLINSLKAQYGTEDLAQIKAQLDSSHSRLEMEAQEAGLSLDEYLQMKNVEESNAEWRAQEEQREREAQAKNIVQDWQHQVEDLRQTFPDIDIDSEIQNPRFASLLQNGIDVESAYFAVHHQDIMDGVATATAEAVRNEMSKIRMSNGIRPRETGKVNKGLKKGFNINNLTREEMDELEERAKNGERIDFRH